MSEDSSNKWWIGLIITLALAVFGMVVSWLSWLTLTVVGHSSELKGLSLNQSNVIPPVVEQSLREIRDKTNLEARSNAEALAKLTELAVGNSKDIGYIKERVAKYESKP